VITKRVYNGLPTLKGNNQKDGKRKRSEKAKGCTSSMEQRTVNCTSARSRAAVSRVNNSSTTRGTTPGEPAVPRMVYVLPEPAQEHQTTFRVQNNSNSEQEGQETRCNADNSMRNRDKIRETERKRKKKERKIKRDRET